MTIENPMDGPVENPVVKTTPKKRGGCLTAFLIVMMILNPVSGLVYFFSGSMISQAFPNMPVYIIPLLGVLGLANLGFGIGVWKWKKWGVYGFLASALVTFVINALYVDITSALSGLVGIALLMALVIPVWKQLE
jgi:hypothetical protein